MVINGDDWEKVGMVGVAREDAEVDGGVAESGR